MGKIEQIIGTDEKIVWKGKPTFWPFLLHEIWITFWAMPVLIFIIHFILSFAKFDFFSIIVHLFPPYSLAGVFIAILLGPVNSILVYKNTEYAITSKRVIVPKGMMGNRLDSINYLDIQNIRVNTGPIDKIFGTGNIVASSASMSTVSSKGAVDPVSLELFVAVPNPYDVHALLKKVSSDVKDEK